MPFRIRNITLFTHFRADYIQFISDIFDVEVCLVDYVFQIGGIQFSIEALSDAFAASIKSPFIELVCDSKDDLTDLKNKLEFFYYRNNKKATEHKVQSDSKSYYLTFSDPEGRIWKSVYYP